MIWYCAVLIPFTGESSAINMQLPLGNKDFDYILDINVYTFDKYGDYNSTTAQVKVSNSFTSLEILVHLACLSSNCHS